MADKRRRRKRNTRKKRVRLSGVLRLIVVICIVVFSLIKLIEWNLSDEKITYSLEYGEISVEDHYKALIIRKELILTSNSSGELTQVANEGEKIKKNQRILDIKSTDVLSVQSSVPLTTEVEASDIDIYSLTKEQVDVEIQMLKEEIASKINAKNYEGLKELSEDLKLKIERRRLIDEKDSLEVSSYSEDSIGSDNLEMGETESLYAPESGILTYFVDGFEDELTYERVVYLEYDQIELLASQIELVSSQLVKTGDIICKIVDDSSWYMIIVVEKGTQNQFDINKELEVQIGDRVISGYIEEIFPTSGKVALAIKFEEIVENFYKERFLNVKITQESFKGLKINTSSLMKLEDQFGVLVVDKYNKVIFKPVKILKHDGTSAIIKEDAYYEFVEDENTRIETVSIYDRIIIDSTGYSPGDTID